MDKYLNMKKFKSNNGQALVMVLTAIFVLLVLTSAAITTSLSEKRSAERKRIEMESMYLAEGGMEDAIAQFKTAMANFQVSPTVDRFPATGSIATVFSPSASLPSGATALSVVNQVEAGDQVASDPDGVMVRVKNYKVTTTVQHPFYTSSSLTLNRIIVRRLIFAFQHAVFYEDDLEILPGPDMTFSGRIHSNHDVYLGAGSLLTVDSEYLRSAGNIYNHRKDNASVPGGTVNIKKTDTGAFFPMDGLDSSSPTWTWESQERWNKTVQSGVHGVNKIAVPSLGTIEPGGVYSSNAGIKIENNTITKNGSPIIVPPGTISQTTNFYNNREGKTVVMTEIDLGKLGGGEFEGVAYENHLASSNGLIYASQSGGNESYQPGIRLTNGSEIKRSGGLTVVTDKPLYIQGDYNSTDKKPAAIISDAVNILSNDWNDENSHSSLGSRAASDTVINTAFIAGIDTTSIGHYNGGLENYPRLHEDWQPGGTQKELEIKGSFLAFWNSQVATGSWGYGDPQYKAPRRSWSYDSSFLSGSMPPFTPFVVDVKKGAWWKE